jgi:hypothetical protein
MSTSVAYLRKRLADIGRHDLLAAADRGDISTHAAAEAAGLIRTARSRVTGNGSQNQARRRHWAVLRATGQAPPLPHTEPQPEPQPGRPVSPLPGEIADIVRKLVAANRADLIIAVAEFRLTPFEAQAIVDRGGPPPKRARKATDSNESTAGNQAVEKRDGPTWDVKALIG